MALLESIKVGLRNSNLTFYTSRLGVSRWSFWPQAVCFSAYYYTYSSSTVPGGKGSFEVVPLAVVRSGPASPKPADVGRNFRENLLSGYMPK